MLEFAERLARTDASADMGHALQLAGWVIPSFQTIHISGIAMVMSLVAATPLHARRELSR